MTDSNEARLATYYDQEATTRAGRDVGPLRTRYRESFFEILRREGRRRIVEVGCGPGRDGVAFAAAGFEYAGLDLSMGGLRLARAKGVRVIRGSLASPPLRRRHFEAGWSMSTLMHVPATRFDAALAEVCSVLQPGAPLGVGIWGGQDWEGESDRDTIRPRRLFSLRSHERAQEALSVHGRIESFETRSFGDLEWEYQFAVVRISG